MSRLFAVGALQQLLPPIVRLTALPPPYAGAPIGEAQPWAQVNSLTTSIKNAPPYSSIGSPASASSVTSISPSLPFLSTGYLMIAWAVTVATGKTFSVDAAWTMGDQAANGAACWGWRKVTAGGNTAPTFSWSGATNAVAAIAIYGPNVKTSGPIGNSAKNSGTGTTLSITGIVTGADVSRIVSILATQNSQSIPTPSGYTIRAQSGANASWSLDDQAVPGAGVSSASVSVAISSSTWEAFLIEILRA